MRVIDCINLFAIIVGPIIAVIIGQRMQEKKQARDDKMDIFKTLMVSRIYPWTKEMVDALNIIDIVFADDNEVRSAWKDLFDKYNVVNSDELHLSKVQKAQYRLLECMAKSLGYKDKITWETIQNPYIPRGLQHQLDTQQKNQEVYSSILTSMMDGMQTRVVTTHDN